MTNGLPFFPLDCYMDESIESIEGDYGPFSFTVIIKLYQHIYGAEGYYCSWTERSIKLFARRTHLDDRDKIKEVVELAIDEGIFSRELYERYEILTSASVQRNYIRAAVRRKDVSIDARYWLIDIPENVTVKNKNREVEKCMHEGDLNSENANIFGVEEEKCMHEGDLSSKNANIFGQRKVKERILLLLLL